ncbi:MAG: hypothetical protein ABI885_27375, partial [Gammaproteobacteria bacterium]
MFASEFGIDLPDSFSYVEWSAFFRCRIAYVDNSEPLGDFVRAMQAVAYRFRGARDALDFMIGEWAASGGQLSFEGEYRQQRELFAFISSLQSSLESAGYVCYVEFS